MAGFLRAEAFRKGGSVIDPAVQLVNFTRVRSADSGHVNGTNVTANWGATPAQGDLLVAMVCHRSALFANPTFDGSNWQNWVSRYVGLENNNDRRFMGVPIKYAGANEPQYVTATWPESVGGRLVLQQFHADVANFWSQVLDHKSADTGEGATGSTAGAMNGTATPPLVIPASKELYTGQSPHSIFRCSLVTGRAGASGLLGVSFAGVGNVQEWGSVGQFQNGLACGFGRTTEQFQGQKLSDTVHWVSDVFQPCAAHLLIGSNSSFTPL